MKPINTTYDVEMDMFYGVKRENLDDVTDFNTAEQRWYKWLKEKEETEDESLVKNELTNLVYNVLLCRNLRAPELKDGMYRASKVIKVNKLMSQKGGLRPWGLEEIKCSGLYTIHPVWFIDETLLPEDIDSISEKDLERLGLPDICLRSRKLVRFPGDRALGIPDREMYCWLESTPFVEAQLRYNSNWDTVFQFD